ncbi:MAG: Rossmann fold nucleotide-binding protein [Ilumatobacter sp.]|uniref:LOG family protein n=1 Tax=Ilumatobacter sp. TaxID=1967498 RepID=UPI003299BBB4
MVEIHTLAEFDGHVDRVRSLDATVVQGVDLSDRTHEILRLSCVGGTFLGCRLVGEALEHVVGGGAVVFPRLPDVPFDPYRPHLYRQGELLDGWVPGDSASFDDDALDSRIYAWSARHPKGRPAPVLDALAQRLHDHAIDDALGAHLDGHSDVVAVMGGHAITRRDPAFRLVADLGRAMTREGWLVATGGGPGAMEAANLGACLAPYPDAALDDALRLLRDETDYRNTDPYLRAGASVLDRFPDGAESLAVPTWFYGHEPTNQFATHVAKYFANSIREDGLLAIATRGVVFSSGSAGTTQEVFQDATQNHYGVFGTVSPMVFLDRTFWNDTLPAEPLLRTLAGERPYAAMIGSADTAEEAMAFLRAHPPVEI